MRRVLDGTKEKVAKYYSNIDLGVLFSGRSCFGSESSSSGIEEGGEATSPAS